MTQVPPDSNPKTRYGIAKPGISSIPPVALLHLGQAMDNGAVKYGLTNWRENEVSASVYYNAAFRHLAAWWDGEREAEDSGVHHLGHAMACLAVLLDAEHMGKLNDDRPPVPGPFSEAVAEMTVQDAPFGVAVEDEEEVVAVAVPGEVGSTDLSEKIEALRANCDDIETVNDLVVSYLDHLGARTVVGLTAGDRRRLHFYLSCYECGLHLPPEEMDDMLSLSGVRISPVGAA